MNAITKMTLSILVFITLGLGSNAQQATTNIKTTKTMNYPFTLPALPYAQEALQPKMSKETIEYHYGKHLATYIANLNGLVKGTAYEKLSLEEIIKTSEGGVFNNAAQTWNHIFFFDQFSATPKTKPEGRLYEALVDSFGSLEAFKEQFHKSATSLFGSGWVWLVMGNSGKLEIVQGSNAMTPVKEGRKAILTVDVWEHAYYIDYRNRRADYMNNFWDIFDWKVAEKRF